MKRGLGLVFLSLCCVHFACKHALSSPERAGGLEGIELDLWTEGETLFVWGEIEGQKARVVFSSVELGNTLTQNKPCTRGQRRGKVLAEGKERQLMQVAWSLEGKALGGIEAALVEAWEAPKASPSKVVRLRDGFVLESDDTQCLLVVGVQQMGFLQMVLEGGRLRFEEAPVVAKGEPIRFAEHPHLGIPFGQFIALVNGKEIPLRLVLQTSRWPSHLHENFFKSQGLAEGSLSWEALKLSLEARLPAGSFESGGGAQLGRYWPWAEGSLGMKAFECCRLVWSPRQGVAVVQFPAQAP